MAVISLYPSTWMQYLKAQSVLTEPHGVLLLTSDYTFSEDHENFGDIPEEAIIADIDLADITYDGANDRFIVADSTSTELITTGKLAEAIILYSQEDYEHTSLLVYYSEDVTGLPLMTSGADITVSFPSGVLALAPSGYTTPSIVITEV